MKRQQLKLDPKNARKHGDANKAMIRASLEEVGAFRSIGVDANNIIRAGNGVYEQAQALGLKVRVIEAKPDELIAVKRVDLKGKRAERAALYDNRTAELSEWDVDALRVMRASNADLLAGVFEADDLTDLLGAEENGTADAEPQIDRAEELNKKWNVKMGDLFCIGEHRLLCGDSTKREDVERVMGGDEAGLVMADPPYGIDASQMTMGDKESSKPKNARLSHGQEWDSSRPRIIDLLALAPKVCIWGAQYFCHQLPISDDWLCWYKKIEGVSFAEAELAWTNYGRRLRVLSHHWSGEEKLHITQKPLPVIQWAIEICPDSPGYVYDPFAGSGTTLVACQNLQRKCRAIEISPNYCAVILERMATAFPGIEIERIEESRVEKHARAKAKANGKKAA